MIGVHGNVAITLRPATPEDRFRIRRWLAEPEIAAWWGNAASAEAEINLAMASDTAALPHRRASASEPIGYAHAVDVGLWGGERPRRCAPGTWDVDLFIGSEQHRSRGLGRRRARPARGGGVRHDAGVACCGLVSIRNEAAVRAYERAGFRWRRIWNDPLLGPCWLMARDRPSRPPDR